MGHTICLLTASLFAGQTGDVKVTRQTKIIVPQQSSAVQQPIQQRSTLNSIRNWWEQNRPNLIQRIQHRVKGRSTPAPKVDTSKYASYRTQFRPNQKGIIAAPNRPKSNEPPLADGSKHIVKYQPVVKNRSVVANGLQLSKHLENGVGAGEKHAWITGQLRKHGRHWVLVYAPEEVVDPYNGRVVLESNVDMSQFRDGEVVHVRGTAAGRPVSGMQTYRINSIDRIPDGK